MFETSSIDNPGINNNQSPSAAPDWVDCKKHELLQQLNNAVAPIIEDELRQINQERPDAQKDLEVKENRIKTLERINADKDAFILELKEKLTHAQELINAYEKSMQIGDPTPMFNYEYDLTDYSQDITCQQVNWLFDVLLSLCQTKLNASTDLIENQTSVLVIYLVLHDSMKLKNTLFEFKGTLTNFVDSWNANVVARIEDPNRRNLLTVNYSSVKSTLNKTPWKGTAQGSWRSLSNDTSNKHHKAYSRAYNIKARLESRLFEQIKP